MTYADAVAKGDRMIALLNDIPRCADRYQSQWTNFNDLENNGWVKSIDHVVTTPGDEGARKAAEKINAGEGYRMIEWKHQTTKAYYLQAYKVSSNAIFCNAL